MAKPQMVDEGESQLEIKMTNTLNGEIIEKTITNAEEAKNLLLEINSTMSVAKKITERVRNYLDVFLGQDEQYQFADGKLLRRVQRETTEWQVEELRKYLDEDQLSVCLKVDKKVAEALVKELMESGDIAPDALKQLNKTAARHASKAYVEVK